MPVADAGRATLFRFQFRPEAQGVSFYKLHVYAESEGDLFDSPGKSSEATLVNNQRLVLVDRGQGPYRVLYVSGRPNWEFKFLRRAVDEDSEVQLVGLVRIARREPKFDFRGHQDESTNPLYRGFGKEEEEQVEQYDEPVILRVGTRDETELRSGFPVDAEELFEYHALILDDVEAKFFTRDQMSLIQRFVSQRGGGFLMLGGMESYALGDYRNTPIGEMLPVYSTPVEIPVFNERFKVTLTREGMLEPWMRLQTTEVAERQRLDSMPEFRTVNLIDSIKPGATVLSRVTSSAGEDYPAVVAQRFGNGRTLAVTLGDLWRWSLRRDPEKPNELGKTWRQTMRWLVADVPQRVDVEVLQPKDLPAQTTNLRVLVRDPTYQPLDNAAVAVTVEDPTGHTTRLIAEASDTEAGVYETTFVPSEPGAYLAEVVATAADGSEVGKRSTGWTAEPARDEFRTLRPNRQLLARVAEQSGGEMIESNRLERFVSGLPQRDNVVTEPWIYPFWHQWWVFAFAVACLIGEWGLRRWKGLA